MKFFSIGPSCRACFAGLHGAKRSSVQGAAHAGPPTCHALGQHADRQATWSAVLAGAALVLGGGLAAVGSSLLSSVSMPTLVNPAGPTHK